MTGVLVRRVRNRLGAVALNNGGMSAREALSRAEKAMDDMRGELLEELDGVLDQIVADFGDAAAARGDRPMRALYGLASAAIEVSAGLPGSDIERAAYSLCDLVVRCEEESRWDWPAVDVHLSALHLLRQTGQSMSAEQRAALLSGLSSVAGSRRNKARLD